jgi:hypothetical protein
MSVPKRIDLENVSKKTKDDKYHQLYKLAKQKVGKLIMEAKQKSWEDFCDNIDNQTSTKEMWNKVKKIQGKKTSFNILNNHKTAKTNKEKADLLSETFSKNSSNLNFPKSFIDNLTQTNDQPVNDKKMPNKQNTDGNIYNTPLTMAELKEAIK